MGSGITPSEQERISSSSTSLSPSNGWTSPSESSMQSISDVVGFSLCSLSTIRLNYLYPEHYHETFRKSTVKRMVEHFGLPPKVENSINEFVADDEFTFLSSIKHNHRGKVFKLIEELVFLTISSGSYDARMHYLIVDVAELLGIPRDLVEIHCESIYELLLHAQPSPGTLDEGSTNNGDEASGTGDQDAESKRYREKRDTRKKIKKYLLIGLASLGGGAVIGVTGGLAAPIVASAFGAAIGAGSFVMSSAAAGVVGSLFGVAGAGLTASKMQKRIGDLEEFSFESLNPEHDQTSLTITIAISGWITDESEQQFLKPWKCLNHTKEQYCLRYESKYLLELSQAMDYLLSFVVSYAAQEALKYTFLAGVMAAIAWPTALISMANIIDNPWDVCVGRSAEAGKHLADVLMSRQQGRRPVSLIGFSLGARVIYFCLQELAQRTNSEGIICDVILLGAPVTASQDQWRPLGRIISGRVVNGYSSSDWLLKFLYRTSSAAIRVAGLQQLCWQDKRVKNVDLTQLVGGHMDYYKKLAEILQFVGVKTLVKVEDDCGLAAVVKSRTSESISTTDEVITRTTIATDSGMERSVSQSTAISASFSQQSLAQQQQLVNGAAFDPLGESQIASLAPRNADRSALEAASAACLVQQQQPLTSGKHNNNAGREHSAEEETRQARRAARGGSGRLANGTDCTAAGGQLEPRFSSLAASNRRANCPLIEEQALAGVSRRQQHHRTRSI